MNQGMKTNKKTINEIINKETNKPAIYVLTGAPGSGKSSIINTLEIMYGQYTIREAAEDYIRMQQAAGNKEPWLQKDFQENIMRIQLMRRERIPYNIERIFLDRDIADGLAYTKKTDYIYETLLEKALEAKINEVFIIEDIGFTNTNDVRKENREEATRIGNKLKEVYEMLGYKPIIIPPANVYERARIIMEEVKKKEKNYGRKKTMTTRHKNMITQ